jgi:hypothetical protein
LYFETFGDSFIAHLCCSGYFFFEYTETNQNTPKLRRRIPRPAKKTPIPLSASIFSPPKYTAFENTIPLLNIQSEELERTSGEFAGSRIYGRKLAGMESNVDILPVSKVTLGLGDFGK